MVSHFLFSGYLLYLCQQILEFTVIYLNSVIQVKADPLVSVVTQLSIKDLDFVLLFDKLVASSSIFFGGLWRRLQKKITKFYNSNIVLKFK
jgi:hypothetical protein